MDKDLGIISKKASELAESSQELAIKLKDLAFSSANNSHEDTSILLLNIFILACFVGYYVVWRVTPSLHTPLMSITNAISGIIIIGALLSISQEYVNMTSIFGIAAIFLASINIFGGFIVTTRMLMMFKKKNQNN